MIRIYFYTISGMMSAIIGWSLSQLFWLDLGKLFTQQTSSANSISSTAIVLPPPDLVLLPVIGASLSIGLVMTEIFLSNPTRYRLNFRAFKRYFWFALPSGIVTGFVSSILTWLMYASLFPAPFVRVIGWGLVGLFTGLGEGISWRLRSIEGGTNKAIQRLWKGTLLGLVAGILAAIVVELIRGKILLGSYEDPLSFMILGGFLGLFLSVATSPSYLIALRAGAGFEMIDPRVIHSNQNKAYVKVNNNQQPQIKGNELRFVTEVKSVPKRQRNVIQEGLSIQLPGRTPAKKPITIGSDPDSDIYLPGVPRNCAELHINSRSAILLSLCFEVVKVNGNILDEDIESDPLQHNDILTFVNQNNPQLFYRFCFYDKSLDPQG